MFAAVRVFNLLVLEEGEEYLIDCPASLTYSHPYAVRLSALEAAACRAADSSASDVLPGSESFRQEVLQPLLQTLQHSQPERGRLRVCSKSLIFDSHHPSADIIKFPFRRILFLHALPTPSQGAAGSFELPPAGGGLPPDGRNSSTLLMAASEITRVPTQLFNGKTRCVRPFTSDSASAAPLAPEPSVQRLRSVDASSLVAPFSSSGSFASCSAAGGGGCGTGSLFSTGASTSRSSWWPAGADTPTGGAPTSQSPQVFLFLLSFENPRLCPASPVAPPFFAGQQPPPASLAPPRGGGAPTLPALIDGLWRASNGKPLIPHIHRPRAAAQRSSVARGQTRDGHAQGAGGGWSGAELNSSLAGAGDARGEDKPAGVLVDTEEYASEQLRALSQHLTFSLADLDHREQLLLPSSRGYWVRRIRPLIHHRGLLLLTSAAIYFQPHPNFTNTSTKAYPLQSLLHCFRRIQCLRPNALELVLYSGQEPLSASRAGAGESSFSRDVDRAGGLHASLQRGGSQGPEFCDFGERNGEREGDIATERWAGKAKTKKPFKLILLEFENEEEREIVARALQKQKPEAFLVQSSVHYVECMKQLWVNGRISTYHYLDFLNCIAGRSKSDYSAYPVFPWTIMRFQPTDTSLPPDDATAMRDLSKPVGALEPQRLQALLKRMKEIQVVSHPAEAPLASRQFSGGGEGAHIHEDELDRSAVSYLYGSHYSTPAFTVHWLVRLVPECQLRLHGGRFDAQQRMFNSMQSACRGALTGQSTFVELIPEFYEYDPSFLLNRLSVFLSPLPASLPLFPSSTHALPSAAQQPPVALADVELPPWPPAAEADSCDSGDLSPALRSAPRGSSAPMRDDARAETVPSEPRTFVATAPASSRRGVREKDAREGLRRRAECGDAASFLLHLRQALEGTWASKHMHNWIDLIFGYKQTGEPARAAFNVFHPLTYANAAAAAATGSCCPLGAQQPRLSRAAAAMLEQLQPSALQVQLQEFGQTPIQLFDKPHPMRLACPPFDASAWEEACGHLPGGGRTSGRSSALPSPTRAGVSLGSGAVGARPLLPGARASVRGTSMWDDMPWFVFMHHNRHLLKGLLDAPPVERALSSPAAGLGLLTQRHGLSLPAVTPTGGRLGAQGRTQTDAQAGDQAGDRGCAGGDGREGLRPASCWGLPAAGRLAAKPHQETFVPTSRAASSPSGSQERGPRGAALGDTQGDREATRGSAAPPTASPLSALPGAASPSPLAAAASFYVGASEGSERETGKPAALAAAAGASPLVPPFAAPKAPVLSAPASSPPRSPWVVWLKSRDQRKPRKRATLAKCAGRTSLTGLALWTDAACCIGGDGSVTCFQLREALCSGGDAEARDARAKEGELPERRKAAEAEEAHKEGENGAVGRGDGEPRGGRRGRPEEEADGGKETSGEDEGGKRFDVGALQSRVVYRLASVPLCSTAFLGTSGVIAVGAFDGSIALHGIHRPQVDYSRAAAAGCESDTGTSKGPALEAPPVGASAVQKNGATGQAASPGFSKPAGASPASSFSSYMPSGLALSRPLSRHVCHADSVLSLCYNPSLHLLISSSSDATVRVWDVAALLSSSQYPSKSLLLLQQVLDEHEGEVTAVASHRHLVLTGSEDGLLLLYDLRVPSQRSGAVWGVHSAGRAPVQSCEISDFAAAAILEAAFLEDRPSVYARRRTAPSRSSFLVQGALEGSREHAYASAGRCLYSSFCFAPSPFLDASRVPAAPAFAAADASCVSFPSSYFPVQTWDLRGASPQPFASSLSLNGASRGFGEGRGARAAHAEEARQASEVDDGYHALLQKRGVRPLCGCLDPALQYVLLAGVRRCAESDDAAPARREGADARAGGAREFEGFLGLYDLRTRNEELSWTLDAIQEPAFLATAPGSAELSVMGGGSDFGGGTGLMMGTNYIGVGDVEGVLELFAAGDGVCRRAPWR
ncbi:Beige/BEACH domain-containing protein [Besnoitia besnoiti]|uniref:Beige/BEACH domain-containing protein n=1 Tax=Besnoitia besnoiti TaxID=94643 RepID=A0A2A9MP42_BESBE|nr:Beige/BEACH domain-containing protein [Besnoitia besnoiti]PFH37783.1 Beige/BEACH domain-containing protein [Besnoitia besnoiti]